MVLDRGNPSAKVFFIGEAPGAAEDLEGRSFVGRSGKLLDAILRSIGLDIDRDIFIASVLKCRPPDNRKPKADEAEACAPHLSRQLSLVAPEVVVILGATALSRLLPEADFAASVGRFTEITLGGRRVPALTIYHPAYLLYSPKKKADMRAHMALLRDFLIKKGSLDPATPVGTF
jgi:uracil-DNA glycosylase family 4